MNLPTQDKPLAIFIVDTSFLLNLVTPIKNKGFFRGEKSLLDTLTFFSQKNLRVDIPAMVALEAGELLHGGGDLSAYFPHHEKKPFRAFLSCYLKKANNLNLFHITPPPQQDFSRSAQFVRQLNAIHSSKSTNDEKQKKIMKARRYFFPSKNFGDIAVCQLLRFGPEDDTPVFYLSDDDMALKNAAIVYKEKGFHLHKLTTKEYLSFLIQSDVLSSLGFEKQTIPQLFSSIENFSARMGRESFFLSLEQKEDRSRDLDAFRSVISQIRMPFHSLKILPSHPEQKGFSRPAYVAACVT